jgi:hypothetical protein
MVRCTPTMEPVLPTRPMHRPTGSCLKPWSSPAASTTPPPQSGSAPRLACPAPHEARHQRGGQRDRPGVIIEFSRHLNRVLSVDPNTRTAVAEPGVVLNRLQQSASPHGLRFGPDPSTHSRCTIAGMVGTNACGSRSVAAVLAEGSLSPQHVLDPRSNPAIQRLTKRIRLTESRAMNLAFPAFRQAVVRIRSVDGQEFFCGPLTASGDPDDLLSDVDVLQKFRGYAARVSHDPDQIGRMLLDHAPRPLEGVLQPLKKPITGEFPEPPAMLAVVDEQSLRH